MSSQREKLKEAEHFYLEMLRESQAEEYERFRYALSAFVNAARNVLQYTFKDAERAGRISDYNSLIAGNKIMKFFKNIRDINIHEKPIGTKREVSNFLPMTMVVRTSEISDEDLAELTKVSRVQEEKGTLTETRYRFDDWKGPEDVLELSDKYLGHLRVFMNTAERLGLLNY